MTFSQIIDLASSGGVSCESLIGVLHLPAITSLGPQLSFVARRRIINLHFRFSQGDKKISATLCPLKK